MKQNLVCIVCPNGCELTAELTESGVTVVGNRCARGADFARAELTAPMRTLTATVRTEYPDVPVLSVRTSGEIPKARMLDVMRALSRITVTRPVAAGEVIIKDVLNLGVDVIATSDALMELYDKKR